MIIRSLIDNDLYKFTMQQAVVKLFPRYKVKYEFINRGGTQFPRGFDVALREEIKKMESLALTQDEGLYLTLMCNDFLEPTYIDFLRGYRYNSSEVGVTQEGGDLKVTIQGYWYRTILWEVPLMALISELYFKLTGKNLDKLERSVLEQRNIDKAIMAQTKNLKVADFGTRRRESFDNHAQVVQDLKNHYDSKTWFVGTSNVYLAFKNRMKPIGTHAHEWFMFHAAKYGYKMSNKLALENWVNVYQGNLGIALSDTFTTEAFFKAFDTKYAKLFDGVRHDSGEPKEFADKVIAHYEKLGIDPTSKTIVFSDGLTMEKCVEINRHCKGRIKCSFGVGTHLTNDVGLDPLNIVIKLTSVEIDGDWVDTVKLSDNPGKHTGKKEEIDICKKVLKIKNTQKELVN
jgi:nicotinate phosphoribosyltransferase